MAVAHVPKLPDQSTQPKKDVNTSFFFTQMVMEGKTKSTLRSEDPREALLKYNDLTSKNPIFFGNAYAGNQTLYHEQTFEEEQESFKKRQKDSI